MSIFVCLFLSASSLLFIFNVIVIIYSFLSLYNRRSEIICDLTSNMFKKRTTKEVPTQIEIYKFIVRLIFAEATGVCTEITRSTNCEFLEKLKYALATKKRDQTHFQTYSFLFSQIYRFLIIMN